MPGQDVGRVGLARDPFNPDPVSELNTHDVPSRGKMLQVSGLTHSFGEDSTYTLVVDEKDDLLASNLVAERMQKARRRDTLQRDDLGGPEVEGVYDLHRGIYRTREVLVL